MPFLVIRISPVRFLESPREHVFDRCSKNHKEKKLSTFATEALAQDFIMRQQILMHHHFLMLSFERLLLQALLNSHREDFFSTMSAATYFSPYERPRRLQYSPRRFFDGEDELFLRRVRERHQQHKPAELAIPSVDKLKTRADLPEDFALSTERQNDIRNNDYKDPVTFDKIDFNDPNQKVACVRLPNGTYNFYDPDSVFQSYKANKGKFKDFLTNIEVDIKDVFVVPAKLLRDHVNKLKADNVSQATQNKRPSTPRP